MAQAIEKDLQSRNRNLAKLVDDQELMANLFSGRPNLDLLEELPKEEVYLYAYHYDELIYWNNQELVEQCPYHSDGLPQLVKNERGSFVRRCFRFPYLDSSYQLTALIPVAIRYPFENAYLQSHFKAGKHIPMSTRIHYQPDSGYYPVHFPGLDEPLFHLSFSSTPPEPWVPGAGFLWLLGMAALSFIIWLQLVTIYLTRKQHPLIGFLITLGAVVLFRWVSFSFGLPFHLGSLPIFHPHIYASNRFLPSLGDLLLSLFCLLWILVFMIRHMQKMVIRRGPQQKAWRLLVSGLFAALLNGLTYGYIFLIRSLVLDSNISFSVSSFNTVTSYTLIGLLAIGMVTVVYFLFLYLVYIQMVALHPSRWIRYILVAAMGLILLWGQDLEVMGNREYLVLLVLIFYLVLFDIPGLRYRSDSFAPQMLFWALIVCLFSTGLVQYFHDVKERETRKRYAEQVIKQRDYVTEYEFGQIADALSSDPTLRRFFQHPTARGKRNMEERFDVLYFGGQLSKYQPRVSFFDSSGRALFSSGQDFDQWQKEVEEAEPSTDPRLYYRENAQDGKYYMARIPFWDSVDSIVLGYVFIDLAAKVSGGESVYPELLHPGNIHKVGNEQGYSFGVYVNQQLITQGGDYSFSVFLPQDTFSQVYNFIRWEGSSELWYKPEPDKTVIVIRFYKWWLEGITLFSYLFGFLMLIVGVIFLYRWGLSLFTRPRKASRYLNLTMRSRIHFSMLGIVLVSFLIIGLVTIVFFRIQYRQSGITKLRSTMQVVERSVWQELSRLGGFDAPHGFGPLTRESGFRVFLSGLAATHGLDINLFGSDGKLLVSSQENIYDKILLSRMMPQEAYTELTRMNSTLVVENEQIGKLSYLSSYVPLKDQKGKTYGYLNVPFFSSEKELNFQISNILVALINLYSFIFLVSGLITVIITRRLTRTLGMMIQQFGRLSLSSNELIDWPYDDEVGLLVTEYNKMVIKLEENAALLARNEREMAWREMARQVAHEITNPLTPMKLNIQYLQQAMKQGHPQLESLIQRVCESLIEQIDNLSYIATEFSHFAKMPEAKPDILVINTLLESALELYRNEENIRVYTEIGREPLRVYADRSQLIRVFNNLLENAVQSIPETRDGEIRVSMQRENHQVLISIEDNGSGISEEAASRVFQPYFTTKSTGTGLGLAMTRKMIEFWNGSIGFETRMGEGSRFYIRLPLAEREESQT